MNANQSWGAMTPAPTAAILQTPTDPLAQARAAFLALPLPEQQKRRDELLMKWRKEQEALDAAKETEAATRLELVALLFDPNKAEGTETLDLGNGWKIKAQKKLNYTLGDSRNDPQFNAVDAALNSIEGLELEEAKFLAERLVRWKPDLSITEYRNLNNDERLKPIKAIIDSVLTTKPGLPSLELIPPTQGKKGKR